MSFKDDVSRLFSLERSSRFSRNPPELPVGALRRAGAPARRCHARVFARAQTRWSRHVSPGAAGTAARSSSDGASNRMERSSYSARHAGHPLSALACSSAAPAPRTAGARTRTANRGPSRPGRCSTARSPPPRAGRGGRRPPRGAKRQPETGFRSRGSSGSRRRRRRLRPGGRGAGTSRMWKSQGHPTMSHELVRRDREHPSSRRAADATRAVVVRARAVHRRGDPREVDSRSRTLPSPRSRARSNTSLGVSPGVRAAARCLGRVAPEPASQLWDASANHASRRPSSGVTTFLRRDQSVETSTSLRASSCLEKNTLLCLSNTVSSIIYRVAPFRWW